MNIDYSKKYQRKDKPEWTAEMLMLEDDHKLWYITEEGESMWCYENEFLEMYEPVSEAAK